MKLRALLVALAASVLLVPVAAQAATPTAVSDNYVRIATNPSHGEVTEFTATFGKAYKGRWPALQYFSKTKKKWVNVNAGGDRANKKGHVRIVDVPAFYIKKVGVYRYRLVLPKSGAKPMVAAAAVRVTLYR